MSVIHKLINKIRMERKGKIGTILESNKLLDDMKLKDGDVFVINTIFEIPSFGYKYDEYYEGIFVYIKGDYEDLSVESLNSLQIYLMWYAEGEDVIQGINCYKPSITWKEIKKDVITCFKNLTDTVQQFEYAKEIRLEYLGNKGETLSEGDKGLFKIVNTWRNNHKDTSLVDETGISNIKIEKPRINIGDTYEYYDEGTELNYKIRVEVYNEDEKKETQVYRALKNIGFTERQAKVLISNYLDKLEAISLCYTISTKENEDEGKNHWNYLYDKHQPILIGLGILNAESLIKKYINHILIGM